MISLVAVLLTLRFTSPYCRSRYLLMIWTRREAIPFGAHTQMLPGKELKYCRCSLYVPMIVLSHSFRAALLISQEGEILYTQDWFDGPDMYSQINNLYEL